MIIRKYFLIGSFLSLVSGGLIISGCQNWHCVKCGDSEGCFPTNCADAFKGYAEQFNIATNATVNTAGVSIVAGATIGTSIVSLAAQLDQLSSQLKIAMESNCMQQSTAVCNKDLQVKLADYAHSIVLEYGQLESAVSILNKDVANTKASQTATPSTVTAGNSTPTPGSASISSDLDSAKQHASNVTALLSQGAK